MKCTPNKKAYNLRDLRTKILFKFNYFFQNREMLLHDEIVFNTNGTLSMVPKHPLVWNEELSMGNREDDIFMLPNIALLVSFF